MTSRETTRRARRGPLTPHTLEEPLIGEMPSMKDLVENIAKALVDNPDEVQVSVVEGEQTTVVELRVDAQDLGKVIGKQGRTARAMRTLLGAAGTKANKRVLLEILE